MDTVALAVVQESCNVDKETALAALASSGGNSDLAVSSLC